MNVGGVTMWFSTLKKTDPETELGNNIHETFPEITRFLHAYYGTSVHEVWAKITDSLLEKITGSEVSHDKRRTAEEYWGKKDLKNMNIYLSIRIETSPLRDIKLDQISFVITPNYKLDRKAVYNVNEIVVYPAQHEEAIPPKNEHPLFGFDLIREWIMLLPDNYKVSIYHTSGTGTLSVSSDDMKNGLFEVNDEGRIYSLSQQNFTSSGFKSGNNLKIKEALKHIFNNSQITN